MKKLLIAMACVVGLAYQTCALELSYGDEYYVGMIDPGAPSNASDEAGYINNLITLEPGAVAVEIPEGSDRWYNRVGSDLDAAFPQAVTEGANQGIPPSFGESDPDFSEPISATGYDYVLGKYGNQSLVWYIGGGQDSVSLPSSWNATAGGGGLSHISLYNSGTGVPDGGTTALLLGLGMMGLGYLSRRNA